MLLDVNGVLITTFTQSRWLGNNYRFYGGKSNNSAQFLEHFFAVTARLRHKKCLISRFVRAVNERWRFSFFHFFCFCCCFFNLKFMRSSLLKLLMFGSSFPSVGFLEHFFAATARLRHKKCLISRFVRAVNERWRFSFFHFFCFCCCFFNLKFMRSSLLKLLMFGSSFPSVG